jgi:hydroxyacylglutathione hydrolase
MTHVVTHPTPPFRSASGQFEVHQIPSWQDNLIWLMVDVPSGNAVAIDGPEADSVLAYCQVHGFELTGIFNTHTHGDHIGINRALAASGRLDSMRVVGSARVSADVPGITEGVDEGDQVVFGGAVGHVMLTEGHINGHVSFLFEDILFCGDTLFGAGCGYLFDGPPAKMQASLARFRALDDGVRVCCAHEYTQDNLRFAWSVEPDNQALVDRIRKTWQLRSRGESSVPSTIGLEKATNPFMRWDSRTLQHHVSTAWPDQTLANPVDVFAGTRALKDRKDYRSIPDDALPLARV